MTEHNPYSPPTVEMSSTSEQSDVEYVGFWLRVLATIIDSLIILLVTLPLLISIYGMQYLESDATVQGLADFLISYVFPAIAVILFWNYKQATPGKMAISAVIVDANTGDKPSNGQLVGRYFSYIISSLPLGLGLIWVAFDARKQGWHDKLANTVVIKRR
ncbi:MAG: RDD family protein [Candidatus Parabeggiatoa sp. nov. 2]|nr:MAG: RDD family protein [Beggiatoa sp. 4572_84]RKZ54991.1 MAG: RDD family protein [Gammaproteobacteria bacterium]